MGQMQDVVEEPILVIPQAHAIFTTMIHGIRDLGEVLPKFACYIFICRVFGSELERHGEHVERIHRHPTRPVRLLDVASGRKRSAAIKDADVIETKESALKYILPF